MEQNAPYLCIAKRVAGHAVNSNIYQEEKGHETVEIKGIKIGEGIPKICIPLTGKTREEIIKAAQKPLSMT